MGWAHVGGLTRDGLLREEFRLSSSLPYQYRRRLADVYIDDFGHVEMVKDAELQTATGTDFDMMAAVDQFYQDKEVPQSLHKAVRGEVRSTQLRGAEIKGREGTVAAPLLRRIGTACLAWLWAAAGANKREAQSILGCLVTSFLFRRELFSCLGKVYSF